MRIAAVRAQLAVADVVAFGAHAEVILHIEQRFGQTRGVLTRMAQDVNARRCADFCPMPAGGETRRLIVEGGCKSMISFVGQLGGCCGQLVSCAGCQPAPFTKSANARLPIARRLPTCPTQGC